MSKIIAIANQKGGVGKTTTAINLSAAIANENKKVLVIDFDQQGNATSGFGLSLDSDKTIYEVIMGHIGINEIIVKTSTANCDIVPANINLAGATVELVNCNNREFFLKNAIFPIKNDYDYIFIDCPPSLGMLTVNGLTACDTVLIPLQTEFFALLGISQLVDTINLIKQSVNPNILIEGVILTMLDKRTHLTDDVIKNTIRHFGNKVYKTMIPRNVKVAESPSFGIPVLMHDRNCVGSKAYIDLAREIIYGEK